jgi:hypothetical protein
MKQLLKLLINQGNNNPVAIRFRVLIVSASLLIGFCFPQNSANAYGNFPNCNINTTTDSNSMWVDGGATPWLCFKISNVQFMGNPIQISGHGVIGEIDLKGLSYGRQCKDNNDPNCDGLGPSIYSFDLVSDDGPISNGSPLVAPTFQKCSNTQFLYNQSDRFTDIDPQATFSTQPVWDQQTAANTLNGPFTIRIPFYLPADCAAGTYHVTAQWGSGSWGGGMNLVGVPGNSFRVISVPVLVAKPTIPTTSQSQQNSTNVPTLEPDQSSGNTISISFSSSKSTKISVETEFPNTKLTIVASTKSSKKKFIYKITTLNDGSFTFKTTTKLRGYELTLYNGTQELDSVTN